MPPAVSLLLLPEGSLESTPVGGVCYRGDVWKLSRL